MIPFLTGSRKYGPFSQTSDIDIVMLYDDAEKLRELARSMGIATETVCDDYKPPSFYIHILNIPSINIIVIAEDEVEGWRYATKEMLKIPPIIDRKERISTFGAFRSQLHR